jgi:peroxiredoxin
MSERHADGTLQPGDRAPNIVLDAITREGKIALEDYRGHSPILVGLFHGLHCPFCRRHIAAQAQLDGALRGKGVETLTVVNTPIDRARLYFRYHPLPNLLAAADPDRVSHRAFGLPNIEFTQNETEWPRKVGMDVLMIMPPVDMPGVLPGPMARPAAAEYLNTKDGYEMTDADQRMAAAGSGQLFGQFLLDREGIVRWTFTEVPDGGQRMFGAPSPQEVMSAASQVAG